MGGLGFCEVFADMVHALQVDGSVRKQRLSFRSLARCSDVATEAFHDSLCQLRYQSVYGMTSSIPTARIQLDDTNHASHWAAESFPIVRDPTANQDFVQVANETNVRFFAPASSLKVTRSSADLAVATLRWYLNMWRITLLRRARDS